MVAGATNAWADDPVVSTLEFNAACGGSGTADDDAKWTVSSDGTESSFDGTKGIHYGTGSAQVQYITLSTSDISGTITKVVVNASTASGVSATVSVTVGGSAFGGDAQTLTSSAADYTFMGSASGEIIVTVTKPSKAAKALYVKSIAVTYSNGGGAQLETSDLALTDAPIALDFDLYNNSSAQVINYTTSSTGAVTVSDNDYVTTAVDQKNQTITVTPKTSVTPAAQTITVSQEADESYKAGSATFTVNITDSTPIPTHTATFSVNGETSSEEYEEGADIEFPANPETIEGKVFVGWAAAAISGVTDNAPEFVTEATMGESDVTFYAVFATSEGGSAAVTDELTYEVIGVTGTSYSSWEDKIASSDAVYAGQTAGGNNAIQLRSSNNNSGIVSTTSGGKLSKIAIKWNNNTADARVLDVYASNTAYTAATDLYDTSKYGTKIGSFTKSDGDKELIVNDEYTFVGFRSNSGAMYVDKLSITWGGGATLSGYCTTVAADTRDEAGISFAENAVTKEIVDEYTGQELTNPNNLTVTWTSSDEDVATVENGVVTMKAVGETTITASFAGNEDYKAASVSYTLTVQDSREAIELVFAEESVSVNVTETVAAPELTGNAGNGVVSYESSNPEVATVDENGVVTGVADGTVTITATVAATNEYQGGTATFTVTVVDPNKKGTQTNPYSVAEAIDAIDNGGDVTGVYAQGIVSEIVTEYSSTYHNISYNISADGTTDGAQLQAFRGKSYNGENFTSANDIQVGDEVVIFGNLIKYNTTYEFAQDNQLVTRRITPTLAFEEESYEVVIDGNLTITATSSDSDGAITYSSNDTDVAEIDPETGVVTAKAMGSVTITATIAETNTYRSFSTDVLLTVTDGRASVNITGVTAQQTTIVADGESTFAVVTNDQENWEAAYIFESDNEDVAMVDETTGEILGISKGTANITATLNVDPEDENYIEGNVNSMSFVITVVNPSHTAHFSFNGTVDNNNDVLVEEGEAIAFPSIDIPDGYLLIGWAAEAVDGFVFDAPETITNAVMGNKDVTYYAVLAAGKMAKTTDKLDNAFTGVSSTTYSNWEDKSVADGSGAVYAGNSAGSNVYIQLRSNNNNSGIVSTTSGGRISKVTVAWNSNTVEGRKLDIYGSNEPYEAVTDVYDIEARGDLLGSIVCGTSTELTIVGDYAYVGVRSNSGAMYLNEIDFTWEQPEYDGYCSVTPKKVTLDETEGYTGTQDYAIVKLNRTVKADTWSSFTVPFNIPAEQIPGFITIKKLTSSSMNGEYVKLNFESASSIEAGVPYMMKSSVEISNIKVYGVDVDSKLNDIETTYAVMKGNMAQMNVPEDAFFISNNTWYQATSNTAHMKAFRAYIELTEFAQNAGARGFVMDIDGEVTRIDTVSQSGNAQFNGTAYDLQGRRVEKPARGLYIVNGKKVLVK